MFKVLSHFLLTKGVSMDNASLKGSLVLAAGIARGRYHGSPRRAARPVESTRWQMTKIGAAVLLAVYGAPSAAVADDKPTDELAEVTVTASRRQQTIEDVPYAIAVINADELQRTGVTDLASLSRQVPGLNLTDFGARYSAATVPIIRGINA